MNILDLILLVIILVVAAIVGKHFDPKNKG